MGTTKPDLFPEYNPQEPRGNRCREHVETDLEEVGSSEYHIGVDSVPPVGAAIYLSPQLEDGRLTVRATEGDARIGLVPVQLNYLAICLDQGLSYRGAVVSAAEAPIPTVAVYIDAV